MVIPIGSASRRTPAGPISSRAPIACTSVNGIPSWSATAIWKRVAAEMYHGISWIRASSSSSRVLAMDQTYVFP